MNLFVKAFSWVFGVLCIISAILQFNDPDPIMWIGIYSVSALLSFGFALGKISFVILLLAGFAVLGGGFYIFPEQFQGFAMGNGDIGTIEEGRESVGLFILGVVFIFFAIWTRYWKKS